MSHAVHVAFLKTSRCITLHALDTKMQCLQSRDYSDSLAAYAVRDQTITADRTAQRSIKLVGLSVIHLCCSLVHMWYR